MSVPAVIDRHGDLQVERATERTPGRTVDRYGRTGRSPHAHAGVEVDGDGLVGPVVDRIGSQG